MSEHRESEHPSPGVLHGGLYSDEEARASQRLPSTVVLSRVVNDLVDTEDYGGDSQTHSQPQPPSGSAMGASSQSSQGSQHSFSFSRVSYQVRSRMGLVKVLHGVSASIPTGSLCAVLGPSGAGKSSLFDVLLGEAEMSTVRGKVPEQLRISYVTQDSHLVVSETVLDVMWFYASLSLPRKTTVRDKRRLIDDILFAMDMSHTVDTYVGGVESAYEVLIEGGLSSGERRRLQVAAALVSKPQTMILDEPTTGLDGSNALHLIKVLRRVCVATEMTALASLHQCRRETMSELDVMLLMTSGRVVYCGKTADVLPFVKPYFRPWEAWENPMDYILEFLCQLQSDQAEQFNKLNNMKAPTRGILPVDEKLRLVEEDQDSIRANMPYPWHRILTNLGRIARIYYYRWSIYNMFGPIVLVIITGLFLACVCLNVDKTEFAHVQIFLNMQSMVAFTLARNSLHTSAVIAFARTCWNHEKSMNMYKAHELFAAISIFELPMGMFMAVLVYLVMWVPVGWGYHAPESLASAICLFMLAAGALRTLFSVAQLSAHVSSAPRLVALYSLIEATGGLYIKYTNVPRWYRWICYINPYFYTIMGLVKIEFENYKYPNHQAQHVVHYFGYDKFTLNECYLALVGLYLVYGFICLCLFVYNSGSTHHVLEIDDDSHEARGASIQKKKVAFGGYELAQSYGSLTEASVMPLPENRLPPVLQYSNLSFTVTTSDNEVKQLLHNISFQIDCGSMFAIMGPSGAGKSSLLKIIGGFNQVGTLTASSLAGITTDDLGYVFADDVLPVLDTIEEVFTFYAEFVLPATATFEEKKMRVMGVIDLMGLRRVQRSVVGGSLGVGVSCRGISGGERRRVSIGCALLKNPAVIVLDEPTSGLDSQKSWQVMHLCHQLTIQKRTVICTIHQPRLDIYTMFKHVMYLAKGEMVYCGPPKNSIQAFEQATKHRGGVDANPADYILDCLAGLELDDVRALKSKMPYVTRPQMKHSGRNTQRALPADRSTTAPSFRKRFLVIFRRRLREIRRNQNAFFDRIKFVFITILITTLPYASLNKHLLLQSEISDRRGLNALLTSFLVLQASNTIPLIQQQRMLTFHEIKSGFYGSSEFYWSQIALGALVYAPITCTVGFFIAWGIAGYRTGLAHWSFGWMNAYILAAFSEVTSAIVSMLMASYPAAVGLYNGPFTCGVLPTSGILIATPTVPFAIRLLAYVNPIHYVVGSEIINQFHNRTVVEDDTLENGVMNNGTYIGYVNGDAIVESMGYHRDTGDKYANSAIAAACGFAFAALGYRLFDQAVKRKQQE